MRQALASAPPAPGMVRCPQPLRAPPGARRQSSARGCLPAKRRNHCRAAVLVLAVPRCPRAEARPAGNRRSHSSRLGDTGLELPTGTWQNELTGEAVHGPFARMAELLAHFPVALLTRRRKELMHTFQVWAPIPRKVELQLGSQKLPMTAGAGGWWEAEAPSAEPEPTTLSSSTDRAVSRSAFALAAAGVHGPSRLRRPLNVSVDRCGLAGASAPARR